MNILDAVLIFILISQAVRWAQYGFSRGFFPLIGYWLGLILGALLTPLTIGLLDSSLAKLIVALLLIFGLSYIFGFYGQTIGQHVFHTINKARLYWVDKVFGAAFSVCMSVVIIWLVSSILSGIPFQNINNLLQRSTVVSAINDIFPAAPSSLTRVGGLINPNNFPQVFLGPEPQQIQPVDPPSTLEIGQALQAVGRSTVRIESFGCGGQITGSGFVAGQNLVVTNAHVIAGINRPMVADINGKYEAQTVYFDPDLDIAVLRVERDLAGPPLRLAIDDYIRGTAATAVGYPGGGPLKAVSAGVLDSTEARGSNIYGQRGTVRSIYILQSSIMSGNSGGPVVLSDGTVIGGVFARSESQDDIGYAVRSKEVIPILQSLTSSSPPVATGMCTRV